MRVSVAALLALVLTGCATLVPEEKWAIGLAVADVATTAYALDRGYDELNPILTAGSPTDDEVILRAVVLNAALHFALRRWLSNRDRGHDRRGWRIVIGIRAAPVLWNSYQLIEGRD